MSAKPWAKWYFSDFRSDPRVRMCSRAARSFWLDLLGLMHEAEPYGHLLVNGLRPSSKQLASILGDSEKDVMNWLAELTLAGVFSKNDEGTIYSRRMVRDAQKAERDKANGKAGGNPHFKARDSLGVLDGVNPTVKAHMSEARDYWPSKANSPGQKRGRASAVETPAPPAPSSEPGWEAGHERWASFRAKLGDGPWSLWFQRCRLNGSETSLIAPSTFERDEIGRRFYTPLESHFGEPVTIKVADGAAYAVD